MKRFFSSILAVAFLLNLLPLDQTGYAAENCTGISSATIIKWDQSELKVGQLGRLTIMKNTPLYKLDGDQKVYVRSLKTGEFYRIYAFKPGMLSVGGGLFVDRDARVKYETPSQTKLMQMACKMKAMEQAKDSIILNDTKASVEQKLGKEKRVSLNEYSTNWYTYHDAYHRYYMVSYIDGKVKAIYSKDPDFYFANIHVGNTATEVHQNLGQPIKGILKGNTNFLISNSQEVETFYKNGAYVTVFFDIHKQGKVTGIQVVAASLEENKEMRFGTPSPAMQQAFEMQMFDLTNASRVENGLRALQWEEKARTSSRKHSLDMAVHRYFEHTNLNGQSPFDRMKAEGITYSTAGENIAMGYTSSIFAHEALMNSWGHRVNILNKNFTEVGIGVQFQAATLYPYYTQNFLTPR